jgi:Kdo2-lipid IVA lauroyltransferase/acyltransferase
VSSPRDEQKAGRVRFSDRCVYWIARFAIGAAARVPEWIGYRLAAGLGRLWFRLDGRRRRYASKFLKQAYPELSEREHMRLGSSATANLFMVPLDMARLTRLLAGGGRVADVMECRVSRPHFNQIPKPFLGLTAHLGSWEVGAVGVAELVGGAHGIARVTKNPQLNEWILKNRENGGLVIHPRRGGFRSMARALEDGSAGLQVVDQNQRLRGVYAPFFGKVASCERAAMSLALRCGYPVIIAAALRRGYRFRFELIFGESFTPENTGNKQQDLLRAVTRVNQALERMIRRAPEQYLWIHDRYRTQPEDVQEGEDACSGVDESNQSHPC